MTVRIGAVTSLANRSPGAAFGFSLLVWFAPFIPLIWIFSRELSAQTLLRAVAALPLVSGITPIFLLCKVSGVMRFPEWVVYVAGVVVPACFAVLVARASRWRAALLLAGLATACVSSWLAYMILRA